MISYWIKSTDIKESTYIPKYYDPEIIESITRLRPSHYLFSIGDLVNNQIITLTTGDEIGKSAYGTGDIPFVRTSDIANWEIKTAPKQGVSKEIYDEYSLSQNVNEGDILLVRDGTYLIGHNCFITAIDKEIIFQSHILKIRINKPEIFPPELFFLALNSPLAQKQIRSIQFTADIIDTLGQRINEVILPLPKDEKICNELKIEVLNALKTRTIGKAFIKHLPIIIETVLETNSPKPISDFLALPLSQLASVVTNRTVTAEFGEFETTWLPSSEIINNIYLPKYYDPKIQEELDRLTSTCEIKSMGQLRNENKISYYTGVEIGKMAYDTGDIPFIRTSDFSNWEILYDPKQGISEQIYNEYAESLDVQENDILLVRDGTYLIGTSCIVTKGNVKSLFCGGLYKIRVNQDKDIDPFLFLGLLNSFIVKRQIRTKQFTRDVIDTIGNRIDEIYIPIPKEKKIRDAISNAVKAIIFSRIQSRDDISRLSTLISMASN